MMTGLDWKVVGRDEEFNEPILENQYGCRWSGGVGYDPNDRFCGECSCPETCPHVIKD